MKKYLIIVLCTLIGVLIYSQIPKSDKTNLPICPKDPVVSILIEKADEYDLEYANVEKMITPFVELGYMDVRINDFRWKYYCTGCSEVPHYAERDILVLQMKAIETSKERFLQPNEQYDLQKVHQWCKRNTGNYAQISFDEKVRFNVVEEISRIFFKHNVPFFLQFHGEHINTTEIKIELYQRSKPITGKKPSQRVEPAVPQRSSPNDQSEPMSDTVDP